jgi:hypothetical protein
MATSDEVIGPDAEFHQLLAEFHAREQARLNQVKTRLREVILPRLNQWGVSHVVVDYSGCGDSGCIDGISYFDACGKPVNMALVRPASDADIEDALYEFLPAGFENNEGGQGTLTIDVGAASVKIAHSQNYTQTTDTTEEFTLECS